MQQIQQLAQAEGHLVRALQTATDRVNQIGTDRCDRAMADLTIACCHARDRIKGHIAEAASMIAGLATVLNDIGLEIVADVTVSVSGVIETREPLPETKPVATVAVEGSPESCPQCGPYTSTERLTPTARRCTACGRQWQVPGLDHVEVRDDDGEDVIDLGRTGESLAEEERIASEEPEVVTTVNRVASVPTATTTRPKPSTNGRKKGR